MAKNRLLTPQQENFLSYYTNPKSETFANALQSGLKAGYSQEYSESITHQLPDWLSESLGNMNRLRKAEKVLDNTLDLPAVDEEGKVDHNLLRIQSDVAKFIAKGIGKATYSERVEQDITSQGEKITAINYITPDGNKPTTDK